MHSVAYSPLGHSKEDLLAHPAVLEVAAEAGRSAAQVLLKWNVQRGVPVIPKASSREHVADNIEGLFAWRLTWDQKARGGLRAAGAGVIPTPLPPSLTPPPPPPHTHTRMPQAKLDALDCGKRFVSPAWHTWDDPEEGGAHKPSVVLAA